MAVRRVKWGSLALLFATLTCAEPRSALAQSATEVALAETLIAKGESLPPRTSEVCSISC